MSEKYPTNREFLRFLSKVKDDAKAAASIMGTSDVMVYQIKNGKRRVTTDIAWNIWQQYPDLSIVHLLYPDHDNREVAA